MCLCTIVPESMLKNIAVNGNDVQKEAALKTLAASARLRGRREVMATIPADATSMTGTIRRTIFSADNTEQLPGRLVRGEGSQMTDDLAANEAFEGAGAVYAMMNTVFKRNSVDNNGLRLDATVHYGHGYDNAFWDGRQMVYGDGDGRLFNRFTADIVIIGHEIFHGVTQFTAALPYYEQPGALNEHESDVFGCLLKQFVLKQKFKSADWLIGVGLFTSHVRGIAIRSMRSPGTAYNDPILGKDPQPAHMRNYNNGLDDNGQVHTNSGIPNRAAYLVAEQLDDSWKMGMIWYKTLTERLRGRVQFKDFARLTNATAAEMYGARSKEQLAVKKAFEAVGLRIA